MQPVLIYPNHVTSVSCSGRFVEFRELGLTPDLVTYNTMLKACMRCTNLPCAEVIMTQLRQQGLQVRPSASALPE